MEDYKIALISDIHFGVRGNSETYLEIMESFFKETLLNTLKENSIKDVRIVGDLFEYRNTTNVRTCCTVLDIFRWYQINHPGIHFKISVGNHDCYYHNRLDVNSLEMLREFPNITIIDKVEEEVINDKHIITYPWIVGNCEAEIKFSSVKEGKKKYDLCLGHFEINGFEMSRGHQCDKGIEKGAFRNYKRVFSGHFHIRNTSNDGKITYLGCPYQMDWGDYGNEKGIHIFNVDTGETTFVQNDDSPKFVKITTDDIKSKDKEKIKQVKGNFVKLIVKEKVKEAGLIKLQSQLEGKEPMKFEVDNQYIEQLDTEELENQEALDKITDPLSFMFEFVAGVEIDDEDIDKETLKNHLKDCYSKVLKDRD